MINKKWLILSMFIPLYGGIINLFILFRKNYKKKESMKNIYILMAMSAILTAIVIIILLFGITFMIEFLFSNESMLHSDISLFLSFILGGYFLNLYVLKFYKQTYQD